MCDRQIKQFIEIIFPDLPLNQKNSEAQKTLTQSDTEYFPIGFYFNVGPKRSNHSDREASKLNSNIHMWQRLFPFF